MRIERKVGELGEITDIIHLDNSEVEALDQAHEIIRERCLQEAPCLTEYSGSASPSRALCTILKIS